MSNQFLIPSRLISRALFALFALWIFITFASLDNYPFVSDYYNSWRVGQITLLLLTGIAIFGIPKLKIGEHSRLIIVLSLFISCYALSYILGTKNTTAYLTISLYILIFISMGYFCITFSEDYPWHEKMLAYCTFAPIPAIIYFVTGIVIQLFDPTYTDHGHNHFMNIRYFNDALLPILILLWMRPSFLAQRKHDKTIAILSILYLYVFFSDGARAIILAFISAFIAILLFDYKRRAAIKMPLLYLVLTVMIFYAPSIFESITATAITTNQTDLIRTSSSGRLDLYLYSLHSFLQDPLFGMGAGNFTLPQDIEKYHGQGHPHNLILLWLSELGALGVILNIILCAVLLTLFRHRKQIPTWGWIGAFTLVINGLLSGSLVYPFSQMLSLLVIVYIYAQYKQTHTIHTTHPLINSCWFYTKLMTLITVPTLILTLYWIYPYTENMPLNTDDAIFDETLIYRAKGPSTWQQNPIVNFPKD